MGTKDNHQEPEWASLVDRVRADDGAAIEELHTTLTRILLSFVRDKIGAQP